MGILSTSQIILGWSPPSTYCHSGVHTRYIPDHLGMLTTLYLLPLRSSYSVHPRSSWDAHHPLPTANPEYSKFILSTSQDHLGMLATLYLLPLLPTLSSYSVHLRSSWDTHHPLPTATPSSYSYILGSSWDAHHPLPMYCYSKFITGQHTNAEDP